MHACRGLKCSHAQAAELIAEGVIAGTLSSELEGLALSVMCSGDNAENQGQKVAASELFVIARTLLYEVARHLYLHAGERERARMQPASPPARFQPAL